VDIVIINIITGIIVLGISLLFLAGSLIFESSFQYFIFVPITAIVLWVLAVIGDKKIVKFRVGFRAFQILLAAFALFYLIYGDLH